ncbi:3-deoxy-D-manno-octulosonic acid transferase [Fibrisoma limi]|uniref:3-deoxy-D-manno-octulosonic acid transferase n=1 Tax=Fibrisoma limi TaxID=663275 RepID=UPI0002E870B3|nr:glycosyltransferase N-terminal domain-containing protein [Fibrisoma limi]
MLSTLYNASIHAYQTVLRLAAPFHEKARLMVAGRRDWPDQLRNKLAGNTAPIAWFHAASLGEFEQGRPVIEAFRQRFPTYRILLTFFSPSGYEVRKNYSGADYICYLPTDTPANARQFVALVKPRIAFFIKYEFWYNYLRELKAADVPIISFSAIFRARQLFFKPYGGFYRNLLTYFDQVLVQNGESVELLKSIGITRVTLAGDTRFDRVKQVADAKKDIALAAAFKANGNDMPHPLWVIGSAWQADMDVLIPVINQFGKPLKVIIAPHEINDEEIERWRNQLKNKSIRYSEAQSPTFDLSTLESYDVLLIDNIGMLSSLYQYGEFAYVGGAFGKGLHNILEAATFGSPVFFGPNYKRFQEAVDLVRNEAAFPVNNAAELTRCFTRLYDDSAYYNSASWKARYYVERNIGATAKVMEVVENILKRREHRD